tara:strand:+ start:223 stop:1197 length:975 start_codon:yes stop_codon:yes gene_type:complete
MISKVFQLKDDLVEKYNFYLFYGNNEGHKKEILNKFIKNKNIFKYEEQQILINENEFVESILNKSLFEEEKIILIKRATDKIIKVIKKIDEKKINQTKIFLTSGILEKRSQLRNLFEKEKRFICVPFYPDDEKTLSSLAFEFIKSKKLSISKENVNFVISRSNTDRKILFDELKKIEFYAKSGRSLNLENLRKIINLSEDHNVSELADNCLAKNQKKIINIFNENNFTNDDSVLIARTLLNKTKKILVLILNYEKTKNVDQVISSARPPIFWKDKDITKKQILNWNSEKIKVFLFKLNELELSIKKNLNNSLNLISDFILKQCK